MFPWAAWLKRVPKIIWFTALAGVLLGLSLLFLWPGKGVTVVRVVRGPAVQAVYASGVIESVVQTEVAPLVTARLTQFKVDEGDKVQPGQELATLDDTAARAQVVALDARVGYLLKEAARRKALEKADFSSKQVTEEIQAQLKEAQAQLSGARQNLAEYHLLAPVAGTVLRREGDEGEVVAAGKMVFSIGLPHQLRANADVDEEDIAQVKLGQEALIRLDAFPDKVMHGRVSAITPQGDPINKSFRVYADLPLDAPLKVGMTCEVNIVTNAQDNALLLPIQALAKGNKVWRVDANNRAQLQPVGVGIKTDKIAQIRQGLTADERIIMPPVEALHEGQRVRVKAVMPFQP